MLHTADHHLAGAEAPNTVSHTWVQRTEVLAALHLGLKLGGTEEDEHDHKQAAQP